MRSTCMVDQEASVSGNVIEGAETEAAGIRVHGEERHRRARFEFWPDADWRSHQFPIRRQIKQLAAIRPPDGAGATPRRHRPLRPAPPEIAS